ncbi:MAG: C45 family peptidase [Patescibacteria group bacterium]
MEGFLRVQTGGSPRDMGHDIGAASRDIIRELVATDRAFYRRLTGRSLEALRRIFFRDQLPLIARRYPDYAAELAGIAEGARLPFEKIALFSAEEDLIDACGGWEKCTSAAVRTPTGVYLLHNEDYIGRYHGRLIVIEAEPERQPAFVSLAYPGTLAGSACGLNSRQIAFEGNSLRFPVRRCGLPKNFLLRDLLAARSLADAVAKFSVGPRILASSATLVAGRSRRIVCVEAVPDRVAVIRPDRRDVWAHTNHVRSLEIDTRDERATLSSRLRLAEIEAALSDRASRGLSGFREVLSAPDRRYLYFGRSAAEPTTLASVIMDPARLEMQIAKRDGKRRKFISYSVPRAHS